MNEDPRLYEIAKKITLDAGLPYTDPRTGVTTVRRKYAKKTTKRKRQTKTGN
jgi:hypothetical protein